MPIEAPKPGDDSRKNWIAIAAALREIELLKRRIHVLEHPNDRRFDIPGRALIDVFEIYQSDTWLKFKVTTGFVIIDGDPVIPTDVETEFTLTSGVARYWFYIDFAGTPTIATAAVTPSWDATKVPLGWVDTATYAGTTRSEIHQREHIFNPCA